MSFTVIIPARYQSSRLPGKPLADIGGKPMVIHVVEQAQLSGASRIVVATDDERIAEVVTEFGAEVCMTSAHHQSGTERLAEVCEMLELADDEIIVNVQGDEPLIPPSNIRQVAENLANSHDAGMSTLATPIHRTDEWLDPNVVKVVYNAQGHALYFSRSAMPYDRDGLFEDEPALKTRFWLRHIGIYAYRSGFIRRYINWKPSPLELIESLEQLRVLWYGEKIHVGVAPEAPPHGVDTPEHLNLIRDIVNGLDSE
ncbi:3-deoxy-manno-octulosonate cytidylyltransferase [Echinimonas agarilytica]|uniref:3-deoxy-manno-octulosonate cytidylyltransferase n=1 Tax=Echinimonas agarilytica TaxID=1215918 RepID=A0AA42B852_9GAMM|nr:3-deoxy-manno-octulosonate cytidylyltransferase [Echinimonas agarilytica]MCM2679946.1 3-deoxy-manno-octulosonate cytidylyltransferase [Echinimonas agarilytica]